MKSKVPVCVMLLMCCCLFSCSKQHLASRSVYQFKSVNGSPDYANLSYWAAHPWKWDPSDSIPAPLRSAYKKDSLADVFFLYPISFTKFNDERWNAPVDDAALNAKTDFTSILYQASAFAEKTRVFAPRYRQANLKAYYTTDTARAHQAFDLAYEDVRAAFIYYLEHYNNGRPIIIASHSQGTTHATRLLKEFFEGKPLQDKLVCAYLAGMAVPGKYFEKLAPCKDAAATGCFVSWRTFKQNYAGTLYVVKETFKASVTNPLLWTTSEDYAPDSLNRGGVLKNFNKIVPAVTDAQVHGNILWSRKPTFFGNFLLRTKNYHIADINFFYVNISENVKTRIVAFLKK